MSTLRHRRVHSRVVSFLALWNTDWTETARIGRIARLRREVRRARL